jgi:hypothetical protein
MSYTYKVRLKVIDNKDTVVKDEVTAFTSDTVKTVGELKELSKNGQYTDIDSETFHVGGVEHLDDNATFDAFHFLLHTIILK